MTSESEFLCFVAAILGVEPRILSLDTAYESLPEWDSVMHLRLVMEIGDRYAADIPIDQVAAIRTLADFYRFVNTP